MPAPCFHFYNRGMCFYPQVFSQSLLILSGLPATPNPLCGCFSTLSSDPGVPCLGRQLCFSTLGTTGFWNSAEACLPFAPDTEARALPREGGASGSVSTLSADAQRAGWAGLGLCHLFAGIFPHCMEFILMIVAVSLDTQLHCCYLAVRRNLGKG